LPGKGTRRAKATKLFGTFNFFFPAGANDAFFNLAIGGQKGAK
jgi:hypothetical protein